MLVTLSMILDKLKHYCPNFDSHISANPSFKDFCLLNPECTQLSAEHLYICSLSVALKINRDFPGYYYLCTRDRFYDETETDESLSGIVIVNCNIDLIALINNVNGIFTLLNEWETKMHLSLINNNGFQELLDLSEDIICSHIDILDPSLKLLSYTKNILCDDQIIINLIKNGYHTEEYVNKFRHNRTFERYTKDPALFVSKDDNGIAKYPTVTKVFRFNNTYSVLVVMSCVNCDITQGLLDLFGILTENIKYYVDKDYSPGTAYMACGSLIADLIGDNIKEDSVIRNRASGLSIPFQSQFELIVIAFEDSQNIPVSIVLQEFSACLPMAKLALYEHNIIMLNMNIPVDAVIDQAYNFDISHFQQILIKYNAYCGVSNSFENLMQIKCAYEQAALSINYGRLISDIRYIEKDLQCSKSYDQCIFKFEDYYIYHMVDSQKDFAPIGDYCYNALQRLKRHDDKHNSDNLRVLYVYLKCQCQTTAAAGMLHMHRNNIIYRINKIEEILKTDLNDSMLLLKFRLAFKYLEIYGISDN